MTRTHDHNQCIESALDRAEAVCAARGTKLTPQRRKVLELIWKDHNAVKAYDLLAQLKAGKGSVAPPTIYRALDFLQAHGLIHRIESLNAYVGCADSRENRICHFLICDECRIVQEMHIPRIDDLIAREARREDFEIDHETIEIHGVCASCAPERANARA